MAIILANQNGNWSATSTWIGGVLPTTGDTVVANGKTITIDISPTVLEVRNDTTGGATAGGSFALNNGITLRANAYAGGVSGNIFSMLTASSITIIGNLFAGSAGGIITISNGGTLNIIGNVTGGSQATGSSQIAIVMNSNGILNITGNVIGGTGISCVTLQMLGISTINITGNVIGGTGNLCNAMACTAGNINITGNVTGGDNANALNLSGGVICSVVGVVIGGTYTAGASCAGSAKLTAQRIKGNGFGLGSSGLASGVGVSNTSASSFVFVDELEYGDLGQSPTSGPIYLTNKTSNVCVVYRPGLSKKTLISADSTANLLPAASDVRSGVFYNYSNNVGTMNVPNRANVALGVSVDNTTGTAVLNVNDIWNVATSEINTSGSIGERLKNCSTVASAGQQIASSLTTF